MELAIFFPWQNPDENILQTGGTWLLLWQNLMNVCCKQETVNYRSGKIWWMCVANWRQLTIALAQIWWMCCKQEAVNYRSGTNLMKMCCKKEAGSYRSGKNLIEMCCKRRELAIAVAQIWRKCVTNRRVLAIALEKNLRGTCCKQEGLVFVWTYLKRYYLLVVPQTMTSTN